MKMCLDSTQPQMVDSRTRTEKKDSRPQQLHSTAKGSQITSRSSLGRRKFNILDAILHNTKHHKTLKPFHSSTHTRSYSSDISQHSPLCLASISTSAELLFDSPREGLQVLLHHEGRSVNLKQIVGFLCPGDL